jgi:membrane fusion protein, multidrug efflux system
MGTSMLARARVLGMSPRRYLIAALTVLAVAGSLIALRRLGAYESTDDAFVDGSMMYVAARVAGQVQEVKVSEHQRVAAGDVLVQLDPSDYEARVSRARAELAAAANAMRGAEAAAATAEAERMGAQVELWRAQRELARMKDLARSSAASQQALDTATAARDAASARVRAQELRASAERAMLGDAAPVRAAEAALREAELALEHTRIRAPYAGVVGRTSADVGAIVSAGQPLMALAADQPSWVMANFKETQIHRMHPGSPAEVTIDAFPGIVWHGHVDSFSPATGAQYALIPPEPAVGNFTRVVQRVPVKIALDRVEGAEDDAAPRSPLDGKALRMLPVGLSAEVRVVGD